jgi:hypothetical protein
MKSIRRLFVLRPLVAAGVIALALATASTRAAAQAGELRGRVVEAVSERPVADAEVRVAALGRTARTDSLGRFAVAVPAGKHPVEVRRLGYTPVEAEVEVPGAGLEIEVQLFPDPQAVEGVTAAARPVSTRMRAFEDRRQNHQAGGRFIAREDLARQELRRLPDVLRRLPGVHIANGASNNAAFLASNRSQGPRAMTGPPQPCFAQIFVDGVQVYGNDGARRPTSEPPNLNEWDVRNLEAIEYYSSPSSTPPEFRSLTSMCGTLVLWTRESGGQQ